MSLYGGLQGAEPKSGWNWDSLAVLLAVVPLNVVALMIGAQKYEQRERAREEATTAFMGTVEGALWESCLTSNGLFPSDIGASPSDSGITKFLPDHTLGGEPLHRPTFRTTIGTAPEASKARHRVVHADQEPSRAGCSFQDPVRWATGVVADC